MKHVAKWEQSQPGRDAGWYEIDLWKSEPTEERAGGCARQASGVLQGAGPGEPSFFVLELCSEHGESVQLFPFERGDEQKQSGQALSAAMLSVQGFIQSVQPKTEA